MWINLRVDAEGIQSPDSTDPKDNLLPDAHLQVAAIKLRRDRAIFGGILLDIRIEQVKLNPADLELPNLGGDVSAKNRDRNVKGLVTGLGLHQRQMIEILVKADRFLPAILVDLLLEVTVPVEKRDRAEVQIEVTCRFAVIAGKNTETAGIIRHRFVKPEFRRKIGDTGRARPKFSIGVGSRHVGLEFLIHGLHFADVIVIGCEFDQSGLARELQHPDWIMVCSVPELSIQMPKEPSCIGLPGPPQIVSKFSERFQILR